MFQNIKVDIIYHKTSTDFEMEFNLCGCCRMRLLTNKTADNKTLVHDLARAVSRSKIIIITGNLFSDDGIISIVSGAISKPLAVLNNSEYGIDSSDEIKIIDGATPLITSEGFFGGCIIESGPQTLILLSENKNIRKNIMQTLIHSYVKELYSAELTENEAQDDIAEPETENNEIITEDIVEENVTDNVTDANADNSDFDYNNDPYTIIVDEEEINGKTDYSEDVQILIDDPILNGDIDPTQLIPEGYYSKKENVENLFIENSEDQDIAYTNSNIPFVKDPAYDGMFIETAETENDGKKNKNIKSENEFTPYNTTFNIETENSAGLLCEDDDEFETEISNNHSLNIPILIISILLLILFALILYFGIYVPSKSTTTDTQTIKNIIDTLFNT